MKKFTFNLGFSIIALKLKKDGLGLVILPGVQVNMLCTLKVTRKNITPKICCRFNYSG